MVSYKKLSRMAGFLIPVAGVGIEMLIQYWPYIISIPLSNCLHNLCGSVSNALVKYIMRAYVLPYDFDAIVGGLVIITGARILVATLS